MVGVLFDHKKTKQKQIIKITPLSGGLESKDFCLIILRLIEKFLAQNKIKNEVIEKTEHIIQLEVLAEKNFLKSFHGIFKLVRVSPFGKNGKIHTSFCKVSISDVAEKELINIEEKDLNWNFFKSTGPGGQHKNKTFSAVRLTHIPTGVVVISANERSQFDNKKQAIKQLEIELEKLQNSNSNKKQQDFWSKEVAPKDSDITFYFNHNFVVNENKQIKTHKLKEVLNGDINYLVE